MNHLFGPVPSRRLGLSLGVDLVPMKTCSLSCIYCQVGETPQTTLERREYVLADEVLDELNRFFAEGRDTDWVTFSGSGEPTLNSRIGDIMAGIKKITDKPICVITNGTLLWGPAVRKDILLADAVMPSLDSAVEETFKRVCRPHADLNVSRIIEGLESFRKEYAGKMWFEIMLVAGINDSERELSALRDAVERIRPDVVQLNTVARPPAEPYAIPLTPERMEEIRQFFGDRAEVIASFKGSAKHSTGSPEDMIREYLKRRPGKLEDLILSLGIDEKEALFVLARLEEHGEAIRKEFFGKRFWEYNTDGRKK